jgi:hypothetical protein
VVFWIRLQIVSVVEYLGKFGFLLVGRRVEFRFLRRGLVVRGLVVSGRGRGIFEKVSDFMLYLFEFL